MSEHHIFALDERLRKAERLRNRPEFLITQRRGGRFVTANLVVYSCVGAQDWSRVGVTVSKKVGNSVVRSKVKRRLRECFRRNKRNLPPGVDIVVIARSGALDASVDSLTAQLIEAAPRALKRAKSRRGRTRGR